MKPEPPVILILRWIIFFHPWIRWIVLITFLNERIYELFECFAPRQVGYLTLGENIIDYFASNMMITKVISINVTYCLDKKTRSAQSGSQLAELVHKSFYSCYRWNMKNNAGG
jgi:hypothetical protein